MDEWKGAPTRSLIALPLPRAFTASYDAIHGSHLAGHHCLVGSVVVGNFHDSGATPFSKNVFKIALVQSYDGGHRTR